MSSARDAGDKNLKAFTAPQAPIRVQMTDLTPRLQAAAKEFLATLVLRASASALTMQLPRQR